MVLKTPKSKVLGKPTATWQLQTAKNQLSRLVKQSCENGPQTITVHDRPAVVVVSWEDYARLTQPKSNLVDFLLSSSLAGSGLDLEPSEDTVREIDL